MYPFSVVLVGIDDRLLAELQPELAALGARVEVGFVNAEAAIEGLRLWGSPAAKLHTTPGMEGAWAGRHLFIVHLGQPPDLNELRRLSGAFLGQPVVAILDSASNPALPVAAMRSGASQVVLRPLQSEDVRSALSMIAVQSGFGPRQGKVVGVAGVTGGCGATTIAINLAYELATQRKVKTILAELSLQVGKMPTYLDVVPRQSIHDLLRTARRLDVYQVQAALVPYVDHLQLLSGPHEPVVPLHVSADDVFALTDLLRQLADVVVLDVPCTYDHLYFETLAAADEVVLVAEQRVPSIRSLQIISTNLSHKRPKLLINRYDANMKGFGSQRLKELLQVPELLTISNDYEAVSTAINHGRPLRLEAPKTKVLADIDQLATRLEQPGIVEQTAREAPTVLAGLMRAIGLK